MLLLLIVLMGTPVFAQEQCNDYIRKGDSSLRNKDYKEAVMYYFDANISMLDFDIKNQKKIVRKVLDVVDRLLNRYQDTVGVLRDVRTDLSEKNSDYEILDKQYQDTVGVLRDVRTDLSEKNSDYEILDKRYQDTVGVLRDLRTDLRQKNRAYVALGKELNDTVRYFRIKLYESSTVYVNSITELTKVTKILDFTNKNIDSFPDIMSDTQLEFLLLKGNQLTALPKSIVDFSNLKFLDLTGNPIPEETRESIQNSIPNCTIKWE